MCSATENLPLQTSLAGRATLGDKSWARLTIQRTRCLRIRGGTPHIPIWIIWSDVITRVGTPHKILRYFWSRGGGHRTFKLRLSGQIFKLGWGHRTKFYDVWEAGGGGHHTFKLRLSGQIFILGWVHSTKFQGKLGYRSSNIEVVGWSVSRSAGRPVSRSAGSLQ